eukprot:3418371-Karenia_brevis.AAC.1
MEDDELFSMLENDDEDDRDDRFAALAEITTEPIERQALWDAFWITRSENYLHARLHKKKLKGREINIRKMPADIREQADQVMSKEWSKF